MSAIKPSRIHFIDAFRGVAIILMVIYHFVYDLTYFGWLDFDMNHEQPWQALRYLIMSMFIFTCGLSLSLAYSKYFDVRKYFVRLLKLGAAAACVTLTSLFLFPEAWIYFGILHFLLFCTLVCLPFIKLPWLALILACVCFYIFHQQWFFYRWPFYFLSFVPQGISQDFVPIFPWLGVAFLGVGLAPLARFLTFNLPESTSFLKFIGNHSLIIYLLHQPILFGLLKAYKFIS